MKRRIESVLAFTLVLFFASCFFGHAENKPAPCEVASQAPPAEKISIPIKDVFQAEQIHFKDEMRSLLTDILRDDAKGITDLAKYRRLKKLAGKIHPPQPSHNLEPLTRYRPR